MDYSRTKNFVLYIAAVRQWDDTQLAKIDISCTPGNTMCDRDLNQLNLACWFDFRLEPTLPNDPASPKNTTFTKVEPKAELLLAIYTCTFRCE